MFKYMQQLRGSGVAPWHFSGLWTRYQDVVI